MGELKGMCIYRQSQFFVTAVAQDILVWLSKGPQYTDSGKWRHLLHLIWPHCSYIMFCLVDSLSLSLSLNDKPFHDCMNLPCNARIDRVPSCYVPLYLLFTKQAKECGTCFHTVSFQSSPKPLSFHERSTTKNKKTKKFIAVWWLKRTTFQRKSQVKMLSTRNNQWKSFPTWVWKINY